MKYVISSLLITLVALAGCENLPKDTKTDEELRLKELRSANKEASALLFMEQAERRIAFKNIDLITSTRTIHASSDPYPLSEKKRDFSNLIYEVEGTEYSLKDFTDLDANIGLLVVQNDNVLFEQYAPGNDRNSKWISFSVTKSVTSMLIGAAIKDGYIESVDEPVVNYLPRLRGTSYEGTTIRNVLHMSSGVAWNEDYTDPNSDVVKTANTSSLGLLRYLADLPKEAPPGTTFNYNTGETNLVGEILRSAVGNNATTYLERKIWQAFGMESDANWILDSPNGQELGGCCISATLRDYARIGIFALRNGQLQDGTQIFPNNWMTNSITPSKGAPYYGYLWWLSGPDKYSARGIFGQMIYVQPQSNLVIAIHSNALTAVGSEYNKHRAAVVSVISEFVDK
jgi:CubicO group peptidase (beta-lactamase class C family)